MVRNRSGMQNHTSDKEKRMLKAGEKQTFKFEIEPLRDLGFIDSDGNHFVESGEYIIRVKDKELKINVED